MFIKKAVIIFLIVLSAVTVSAKTLTISTDNWVPYENIGDKDAPGFSTEVVRYVLKTMNTEASIREFPWARALENVYKGKTDALFSAFFDYERSQNCYFPNEPLTVAKYVLFIQSQDAEKLKFDSYDDLKSKRIGLLRGASYPDEFKKFVKSNCKYEEITDDKQNFLKLTAGRLDYIVAEHGNGIFLIKELELVGKVTPLLSKPVREDNIYIIFSKRTVSPEYVKRFSEALKEFKSTGKYVEIYRKYFRIKQN